MVGASRAEKKYQMLKLIHSGRTLAEAKAIMKATEVALNSPYVNPKDVKDLLDLEGGLHRITMTRGRAVKLAKLRFQPRKGYASTKEEVLAKFVSDYKGSLPLDWKRDGNLIRRGPPNKPKPGSSQGKIGKTRVIGAREAVTNFEKLIRTLMTMGDKRGKKNLGAVRQAAKSVRKSVNIYTGGGG